MCTKLFEILKLEKCGSLEIVNLEFENLKFGAWNLDKLELSNVVKTGAGK